MKDFSKTVSDEGIAEAAKNLSSNNFETFVVADRAEAVAKVKEIIPLGAEVMTMTSVTLDESGVLNALSENGKYDLVKAKLVKMDRATQSREMQRLGAAAQVSIGSVHAVTEDGKVLIASNTGSQLPGYVYGSDLVVWVVGGQKVVKDLEEGMKRVYDYVLPLESERAKNAYGAPGSFVSKLLIYNREVNPNRVKVILVKEALGF